jgi:hypothetical protein
MVGVNLIGGDLLAFVIGKSIGGVIVIFQIAMSVAAADFGLVGSSTARKKGEKRQEEP